MRNIKFYIDTPYLKSLAPLCIVDKFNKIWTFGSVKDCYIRKLIPWAGLAGERLDDVTVNNTLRYLIYLCES